jgi:hypothetical protein
MCVPPPGRRISSPTFGTPGRGLGFRFLLVFQLDTMVHIVEHNDFMPRTSWWKRRLPLPHHVPPTSLRLVQPLLCTLRGSTLPRKRPGHLGLCLGRCRR